MAPNSRYRECVTPLSIGKVKPVSADVEADELEEPNPVAGKRKGLRCQAISWYGRAFATDTLCVIEQICGELSRKSR